MKCQVQIFEVQVQIFEKARSSSVGCFKRHLGRVPIEDMSSSSEKETFKVDVLDVTDETLTKKVAALIAEGMCHDSGWAYIFGKNNAEDLQWMIVRNLWLHKGSTYVYQSIDPAQNDGIEVVGTCTIMPPGHKPASLWQQAQLGLLKFPFLFGIQALKRLFEVKDFFDKSAYSGASKRPTYALHMMCVDGSIRGKGYGTSILRDCLEKYTGKVDGPKDYDVVLETQTERNVTFYERSGFKVQAKSTFHGGPEAGGFYSWSMKMDSE